MDRYSGRLDDGWIGSIHYGRHDRWGVFLQDHELRHLLLRESLLVRVLSREQKIPLFLLVYELCYCSILFELPRSGDFVCPPVCSRSVVYLRQCPRSFVCLLLHLLAGSLPANIDSYVVANVVWIDV